MKFLRKILIPFSVLYALILRLRNMAYNQSWLTSVSFNLPIICVGNLSLGGTGKSPAIEYLIRLLNNTKHISTLSRGYGRKTNGFIEVQKHHQPNEVGDEPLQFKTKFPHVTVAVDEQRVSGVEELIQRKNPDVILLDDAFQHRKIQAGLSILLSVCDDLYCDDWVLPAGNLREPKSGAKRADLILITKCPKNFSLAEQEIIIQKLKPRKNQSVFFSYIAYDSSVFSTKKEIKLSDLNNYTLVTGIANSLSLVNYLNNVNPPKKHISYADHHNFTPKEIQQLKKEALILTTEKDFTRLKNDIPPNQLFYIPIQMKFLNHQDLFDETILNYVTSASSQMTNN